MLHLVRRSVSVRLVITVLALVSAAMGCKRTAALWIAIILAVCADPLSAQVNTKHWTPLGTTQSTPSVAGRVTAIATDPSNSNNIWVGTAGGGLWQSTDGGASWVPLVDGPPIGAVAYAAVPVPGPSPAPTPIQYLFAGTGEFHNVQPGGLPVPEGAGNGNGIYENFAPFNDPINNPWFRDSGPAAYTVGTPPKNGPGIFAFD